MDQRLILAFLLIAFGTIELIRGRFIKAAATTDDRVVEIFNTVTVPLLVVPGVFLIAP